ncbi:MAG: ABC transporter permease [Lachnospiraceae bacterium]|nr:ABC transporter permease [Lachnospiraceae bacterium]
MPKKRRYQEDVAGRGLWADAWYRFKKNKLAVVGLTFVVILVCVSIGTIILDLATDNKVYEALVVKQNLSQKLDGPSLKHFFGCDEFGRDILFRLLWGTRYSLFIGVVSILSALIAGGLLGAVAGYYGGITDNIIMRIMDVFLSIPSMVMAIAIVSALGTSTMNLLLSISIPQIPRLARIVRAQVMSVKGKEFVEASRAVGAGDMLIIMQYIIPNALAPIIVQASLSIGSAILSIAGLSFLGIGVQPPTPEWGSILSSARTYMRDAWHISVIPGLMIMLTVLSLNLAGDGLRDALDPKMKN